jgi:hypothetical protein
LYSNILYSNKKNKISNATKVIILLTFIGIGGIVFGTVNRHSAIETVIVDIPIIRTSSMSSSTNQLRNISVAFSVELDRRSARSANVDQIYMEIHQVLTTIDNDIMIGENNIELIKNEVHAHLATIFNEDELIGVYITNIFNDGFEPIDFSG